MLQHFFRWVSTQLFYPKNGKNVLPNDFGRTSSVMSRNMCPETVMSRNLYSFNYFRMFCNRLLFVSNFFGSFKRINCSGNVTKLFPISPKSCWFAAELHRSKFRPSYSEKEVLPKSSTKTSSENSMQSILLDDKPEVNANVAFCRAAARRGARAYEI